MLVLQSLFPGAQDIIDKLFPSGWQPFLVQFIAMLVLVAAFFILLFKPVRKIITTRQDHIEANIKEAEEKRLSANEYLSKSQEEIKVAKIKAQDIIVEAQKTAENEKNKITNATKEEVRNLKIAADKDIEESRRRAKDDIKREIIDVAFQASEKILQREINEDDNEKVLNNFIDSLNEEEK